MKIAALLAAPAAAALLTFAAPAPAAETVAVPRFRGIELHGGGEIAVRYGRVQRVTLIEGSSAVTHMRLKPEGVLRIDVCEANCPDHYRLRVVIETPSVASLAIDGGGRMVAEAGFPAQKGFAAALRGGGQIDGRAVEARSVQAAVKGGGSLLVRASANLSAAVQGGGSIRYWGHPHVMSAVSGGGSIDRGG